MAPWTGPGDPASGHEGPTSPGQSETPGLAGPGRAGRGPTRSSKRPLAMGAPAVVCVRRKAACCKGRGGAAKAKKNHRSGMGMGPDPCFAAILAGC
jgi:hypothetical protein